MADRDILSDPAVAKIVASMVAQAPAFAGAVLSLAFVGKLSAMGRIVAVITGLFSAIFLGPMLSAVADLVWPGQMPVEVNNGIIFVVGVSGAGALPALLEAIKRAAGDPLGVIERIIPARKAETPPPANNGEGA